MANRLVQIAAACVLLALAACARTPTDPPAATGTPPSAAPATALAPLPAVVATARDSIAAECSGVGGTPHTEHAVHRADLNGDGHEDYVLYTGWIDCENAASIYGDRTKFLAVYTGDGRGGAIESFTDWAYDAKLEGDGAATKLWLTVAGDSCGRPPAPDFASEAFCDRAIDWNPVTGRFDYVAVSTVRMIE